MKEGSFKGGWFRLICYFMGHKWTDKDWRGNPICSMCHKYKHNEIMN